MVVRMVIRIIDNLGFPLSASLFSIIVYYEKVLIS